MNTKERNKIIENFLRVGNSPIKHTFAIFKSLLEKGYENEVPLMNLKSEIKLQTGIINDKKAIQLIKTFSELGFITTASQGMIRILFWKDKEEIEKEAKEIAEREIAEVY